MTGVSSKLFSFFSEDLFFVSNDYHSREEVLKHLCSNLEKQRVVNNQFYDNVIERENASSTAFEQITIPHSVFMDGLDTKISVLISSEGIQWGDKLIHIVFLPSINYADRETFTDVYEGLISIFDEANVYSDFKKIEKFKEFEKFVKSKVLI